MTSNSTSTSTSTPNIIQRDPSDLRPHPLTKDLPRWAKDDPRFYGLCDDIRANGIQVPLRITQAGDVLDGETCRLAAKALQIPSVPCVIVPDDEAAETVLRGLVRRRHLTKAQMAFLAVPLIQPAFEAAQKRRSVNAAKTKRTEFVSFSVSDYAASMGMSQRYLQMAEQIFGFLEDHPEPHEMEVEEDGETVVKTMTLQEWVTLRLFDAENPQGLTEINKAAGYFVACWENPSKRAGGPPKTEHRQMQLFEQNVNNEIVRWSYWAKASAAQKLSFFESVKKKSTALPPEQLEDMAQYHEQMARTLRKAKKQSAAEVAA